MVGAKDEVVPMSRAREEVENEKTRKCGSFVACPYGNLKYPCTHVGGKGGGRNRKTHVLESVVSSWFAHTDLYSTHVGDKGRCWGQGRR